VTSAVIGSPMWLSSVDMQSPDCNADTTIVKCGGTEGQSPRSAVNKV
jgi:hypothetical protein